MYESHGVFLSSLMVEHPVKEDGGSNPFFDNYKITYRGRLHKPAFLFYSLLSYYEVLFNGSK